MWPWRGEITSQRFNKTWNLFYDFLQNKDKKKFGCLFTFVLLISFVYVIEIYMIIHFFQMFFHDILFSKVICLGLKPVVPKLFLTRSKLK